jgi:glutathione peroxidase
MNKLNNTVLGFLLMGVVSIQAQKSVSMSQSIHQFTVTDLSGEPFDMASLKGKKVMIVNTASKCGLTPQYENLQYLYEQYNCDNFEIVGFPANNFLWQEPGSDEKIADFCQKNYGVTFPMMSKISVKGKKIHPVYAFLTQKEKNGVMDSTVKWNFQKYLIDEDGVLVRVVGPRVLPDDPSIIEWIRS